MSSDKNTTTSRFHWDKTVIAITVFTLTLLIAPFVWLIPLTDTVSVVTCAAIVVCIAPCFALVPIRLRIDDRSLCLKKAVGQIIIPLHTIRSIETLAPDALAGSVRTFGSGGFLGYLGHFKNKKLGHYILFATERRHLLKVATDRKTYVFSCRDGEKFRQLFEAFAATRPTP